MVQVGRGLFLCAVRLSTGLQKILGISVKSKIQVYCSYVLNYFVYLLMDCAILASLVGTLN